MKTLLLVSAALFLISLAFSGAYLRSLGDTPSRTSIPNPEIDYAGFQKIVDTAGPGRELSRLTEDQFLATMKDQSAIVLDARSANMFALRHIKGAISLPFTDFTAASLAAVLPTKDARVLIYCNNNFTGAPVSFTGKSAPASLNLSTYTSLKAYGYNNVNELGPLLDVKTTKLPFEGTEIK